MNEVSSSDVLSWCIHCLLLSYGKIMPFWWKVHLWINLHLIHQQNIRASHQNYFHTHRHVILLLLVVLLFITQLQQQFFPLTYFFPIAIGYSPPGYCCCFALIVFISQRRDWRRYQSNLCSLDKFFSVWGHPWPF